MPFRIHALPVAAFEPLFGRPDDELAERGALRRRVDAAPGYPCRVSLADAPPGTTVLLLNYEHQGARTPYRASHAIFVREGAVQARPAPGEVPLALARRLLSVRAFDAAHMMVQADIVDGSLLAPQLAQMLADPAVAYVHLHHARQGCYAARADRAWSRARPSGTAPAPRRKIRVKEDADCPFRALTPG
jgi:hypothetical protein